MIYEHAHLTIVEGRERDFERAYAAAAPILATAPGCRSVALYPSVEAPRLYLLRVGWDSLADHLERFPRTPQAAAFAEAVGGFFGGEPDVTHFDARAIGPDARPDADPVARAPRR